MDRYPSLQYHVDALTAGGASVSVLGFAEQWVAPAVRFVAPTGFGEEAWTGTMSETALAWTRSNAQVVCEFGPARGRRLTPGQSEIMLAPAGTPDRYRYAGAIDFANFYLPRAVLNQFGQRLSLGGDLATRLRDDLIFVPDRELCLDLDRYMDRAAATQAPPTRLEMETRTFLIVEQLLARHHQIAERAPQQWSIDWRIRRTIEQIEAQLGKDLGLAELAAAANLSASHYVRLFKAATGIAPHTWVMRRRIDRARVLLGDPRRTITMIALELGFASSQHFATAFRRQLGVTPSQFRHQRQTPPNRTAH